MLRGAAKEVATARRIAASRRAGGRAPLAVVGGEQGRGDEIPSLAAYGVENLVGIRTGLGRLRTTGRDDRWTLARWIEVQLEYQITAFEGCAGPADWRLQELGASLAGALFSGSSEQTHGLECAGWPEGKWPFPTFCVVGWLVRWNPGACAARIPSDQDSIRFPGRSGLLRQWR